MLERMAYCHGENLGVRIGDFKWKRKKRGTVSKDELALLWIICVCLVFVLMRWNNVLEIRGYGLWKIECKRCCWLDNVLWEERKKFCFRCNENLPWRLAIMIKTQFMNFSFKCRECQIHHLSQCNKWKYDAAQIGRSLFIFISNSMSFDKNLWLDEDLVFISFILVYFNQTYYWSRWDSCLRCSWFASVLTSPLAFLLHLALQYCIFL